MDDLTHTLDHKPVPSTSRQSPTIAFHHIILLCMGQILSYLQGKSYKIYSGFIHTELGISYRMLSYTVFASGYISIFNLFISKHYNRIRFNVFAFGMFMLAALSSTLLYSLYSHTFIIFLSRPMNSIATMAMWSYLLPVIFNVVHNPQRKTMYLSWWNSAYPLSSFLLVITGVIIHNLSYFDYLFYSAIASLLIALCSLCVLPSFTIYSLSQENQESIDRQIHQSIVYNMMDICSHNKLFFFMMVIGALDSMMLSAMNLLIGPYLMDNYALNAQQLGVYVVVTIGAAELVTAWLVVPFIAKKSRFHYLILAGSTIEMSAILVWNISHSMDSVPPFSVALVVIFCIFFGHESMFCGILFKNEHVCHKSQQMLLSSFWTCTITVSGSIGNLIVGELYEQRGDGVHVLLTILAGLASAAFIGACALCYVQFRDTRKKSLSQLG